MPALPKAREASWRAPSADLRLPHGAPPLCLQPWPRRPTAGSPALSGPPGTPTPFPTPQGSIPPWPTAPWPQDPSLPCTVLPPVAPDPLSQPRGGPTRTSPPSRPPRTFVLGWWCLQSHVGLTPKTPDPAQQLHLLRACGPPSAKPPPSVPDAHRGHLLSRRASCLQRQEDGGEAPETPAHSLLSPPKAQGALTAPSSQRHREGLPWWPSGDDPTLNAGSVPAGGTEIPHAGQ